jgi:hypothetical protein
MRSHRQQEAGSGRGLYRPGTRRAGSAPCLADCTRMDIMARGGWWQPDQSLYLSKARDGMEGADRMDGDGEWRVESGEWRVDQRLTTNIARHLSQARRESLGEERGEEERRGGEEKRRGEERRRGKEGRREATRGDRREARGERRDERLCFSCPSRREKSISGVEIRLPGATTSGRPLKAGRGRLSRTCSQY